MSKIKDFETGYLNTALHGILVVAKADISDKKKLSIITEITQEGIKDIRLNRKRAAAQIAVTELEKLH